MMIRKILPFASWLVSAALLLFTARRWLFTITALLTGRASGGDSVEAALLPTVLILVPVRNEMETLTPLLVAIDQLNYNTKRLQVVLIDDGSTDGSEMIMHAWAGARPHWQVLTLAENVGKAQALNEALAMFPVSDIVVVYDADERPQPDSLVKLVAPFSDPDVGAVSGRRAVGNALSSPAASYTAFENLVHQWITMRAKDALNLAPAILGANCAYRREALADVGAFKPGALLEDSDLSVKFPQAGWRLRFATEAVSTHDVPESLPGYWQQHTRWARGFNEVARDQATTLLFDQRLSWPLRLELLVFSLGYLDRLALAAAAILLAFRPWSRFPAWALAASLLTPFFQVAAALQVAQEPPALWRRIVWLPIFFLLDLAMAASGLWAALQQTPLRWEERQARQ